MNPTAAKELRVECMHGFHQFISQALSEAYQFLDKTNAATEIAVILFHIVALSISFVIYFY